MKLLGILFIVLMTTAESSVMAEGRETFASQLVRPAFNLQTKNQCHGPADCSKDEYCWTPGVCIPATCKVAEDCALNANCYMGWCQYGE